MKNIVLYSVLSILIITAMMGCDKKSSTFTNSEIELITIHKNSIMPLVTINNTKDSIFLREIAKPLTKADIESEYFSNLTNSMLLTVTNPENEGVVLQVNTVKTSGLFLNNIQTIGKNGTEIKTTSNTFKVPATTKGKK